ncbi:MAG: cytochrome c3 family protein [Acidobacteriia bacterium]|nr:cytochrome c3 family protein [Terriglobia bacterium]
MLRAAGVTLLLALLCRGQSVSPGEDKATRAASQNSACLVCHGNYRTEQLAARHAQAGVGCPACHGRSVEHCGNEENIVAPQIMYSKSTINSSCRKCHPTHKTALTADANRVCTDCHGKHRLSFRTKVWDKVTGALLKSQ